MPLRFSRTALLALSACLLAAPPVSASDLVITVTGIEDRPGEIGCSLYASDAGFPMDPAKAQSIWQPVSSDEMTCRFQGLAPGPYAVAVSQDFNGNRETDTNFLGIPREPWGVTNNIRPGLRAPRFYEAQVMVAQGESLAIEVEIDR